MRRIVVLLLLLCVSDGGTTARDGRPLTTALVALSASAMSGRSADRTGGPEPSLQALDDIATRVQERLSAGLDPSAVTALNAVVFDELGFVREVEDPSLAFVLLPSVLHTRRGSCVGLGTLYLALGEALGWTIEGIMLPGHFYVRVHEAGRARNVELLRRGEEMPDSWYRNRFPIAGGAATEYDGPLSSSEVLGVVEYDIGNERRRAGRLVEARRFYDAARGHFTAFAEAHASSAMVSHLLGALDEAHFAYLAAARANVNLPGLDGNIDLLERERRARSVAVSP